MSSPERKLPGVRLTADGLSARVFAPDAERLWLCVFDGEAEERIELSRNGDWFNGIAAGVGSGVRYGLRADGPWKPDEGYWFDPARLLACPFSTRYDRRWEWDVRLAAARGETEDTASLVPKAIAETHDLLTVAPPVFRPGGLIYEANVRALTMRHPSVPEEDRGTIRAVAHPAIIEHLQKLGVSAIELMPVTAWISERHLKPLGLVNAWGYNPVTFMALDPLLAPGGVADLAWTVRQLRDAGIGTILDLVFNHTGEADVLGPILSLRGLANRQAYRHVRNDAGALMLVNDVGTGNTVDCSNPFIRTLIIESLRHFVLHAGVDGFRFDLATTLGRDDSGFAANAETLEAIRQDPVLADRILIAEPWDMGPGGYQLGAFGEPWLEWNDRFRDDVRRFWRGDGGALPSLATRLSGSSDVFAGSATRSVNFLAAHDGFTLADLVAYEEKHNEANGEENRDGHNHNFSWNNGAEGESTDKMIAGARMADLKSLLATLFLSKGSIMLTAGDEFGRSQTGNNNAYAQDNEITWLDWDKRDTRLEAWVQRLAEIRANWPGLTDLDFHTGRERNAANIRDVVWLTAGGTEMNEHDWHSPRGDCLQMVFATGNENQPRATALFNRARKRQEFQLPHHAGWKWVPVTNVSAPLRQLHPQVRVPARSVQILLEVRSDT